MAKQSKKTTNPMTSFLKGINTDSTFLADNSLSIVNEFIDTGSYALNAIISGSLYGGIPAGIITGFSGPSMCGKSLIAAKIVANAQKKGYRPIIWESEGAWDSSMANLGVDIDECYVMPVATVEEVKNQMTATLKMIKEKELDEKFIFVLDSLGALSCQKELDDSEADKTTVDMGTRAKVIKAMSRQVAIKIKSLKIPMIFTNHIYDNPAQLHPSIVKNQSGGMGPQYLSTVLVQMGLRHEKVKDLTEEEAKEASSSKISGSFISALTIKNRIAQNFLDATLYINFSKGLDRYAGLFDIAKKLDVIVGDRTYALSDGTPLGYLKNFENDHNIWEKKIMPLMEPVINAKYRHSAEEIAKADQEEAEESTDAK